MKIALGTAQFGMHYGVANQAGRVGSQEVAAILALARTHGITTLDSANAYGDSQRVLGKIGVEDFALMSKIGYLQERMDDAQVIGWIGTQCRQALAELGLERLSALFIHDIRLLETYPAATLKALRQLKAEGLIAKMGVSLYNLEPFAELAAFDVVQLPYNLIDRRLERDGCADFCRANDIEIHVRSAFLQGLLLMPAAQRPDYFSRWSGLFAAFEDWLAEYEMSALEACIRYVVNQDFVDKVVFGVDSRAQLAQILTCAEQGILPSVPPIASTDAELINPSRWRL